MIKAKCYTIDKFPDGTPHIIYDSSYPANYCPENTILWKYENIGELAIVVMIAEDMHCRGIRPTLIMPYIPNARMDRVTNYHDVFTLKWFANILNNVVFDRVFVFDPHSDVAPALIDNCELLPKRYVIYNAIELSNPDILYFPDTGAMKRYSDEIKASKKPVIYGQKKRDWDTGKIVGLDVIGEIPSGATILMIDDICAYGGTMFYSALKLKELGAGDISMYVSHCENSILDPEKGHLFDDPNLIKQVYTTDSLFTGKHDKIHVLEQKWDGR